MALNKLSIAEMVKHSGDLVTEGSDERAAIESLPEAAALMPRIIAAHDGLVAAQPPNESEIAKLTEEIGELDADHDDMVRGVDGRLACEIILASDEDAEALTHARTKLLPEGLSIVQRSYTEEAGEAQLRAARVDGATKAVLEQLELYDGRKLVTVYDRLQQVATRLGALVKLRAELGEEGRRVADAHAARLHWIRTINGLAAVLEMVGADEEPILGRIREAELEAERRAARRQRGTDGEPTSTGGRVTTDEPVLTDAPTDTPVPEGPVPEGPVPDAPPVTDRPGTDEPTPPEPA